MVLEGTRQSRCSSLWHSFEYTGLHPNVDSCPAPFGAERACTIFVKPQAALLVHLSPCRSGTGHQLQQHSAQTLLPFSLPHTPCRSSGSQVVPAVPSAASWLPWSQRGTCCGRPCTTCAGHQSVRHPWKRHLQTDPGGTFDTPGQRRVTSYKVSRLHHFNVGFKYIISTCLFLSAVWCNVQYTSQGIAD